MQGYIFCYIITFLRFIDIYIKKYSSTPTIEYTHFTNEQNIGKKYNIFRIRVIVHLPCIIKIKEITKGAI